jgi:RimJ/RimL family protein N-acetyltransferase
MLKSLAQRVIHKSIEWRLYARANGAHIDLPTGPTMHQNDWSDLLKFNPVESWQNKTQFLTEARERIERGERVFTHADGETLLHYGWFAPDQKESFFSEIQQRYQYPPGSAVLYDFYTDPDARGRGFYRSNLLQMLQRAAAETGIKQIYISVNADNGASRHVIESVGFQHQVSLHQR